MFFFFFFLELDPIIREIIKKYRKPRVSASLPPPPLTPNGSIDRFNEFNPPPPPRISLSPFPSPPPANDQDECDIICRKYNINGGKARNDINIYGGWSMVEIYREVVLLIKEKNDLYLRSNIFRYKQNAARDIKCRIKSVGKISCIKHMREGIYKKIKELQLEHFGDYNNNDNNNNGDDEVADSGNDNNDNNEYDAEFGDVNYDDYDLGQYDYCFRDVNYDDNNNNNTNNVEEIGDDFSDEVEDHSMLECVD
ncbi:MAG: hypothetical protein GY755_23370 [Chloroflexi bacterium]|nr:hypothetical protein [Chloroflexota bacterium]